MWPCQTLCSCCRGGGELMCLAPPSLACRTVRRLASRCRRHSRQRVHATVQRSRMQPLRSNSSSSRDWQRVEQRGSRQPACSRKRGRLRRLQRLPPRRLQRQRLRLSSNRRSSSSRQCSSRNSRCRRLRSSSSRRRPRRNQPRQTACGSSTWSGTAASSPTSLAASCRWVAGWVALLVVLGCLSVCLHCRPPAASLPAMQHACPASMFPSLFTPTLPNPRSSRPSAACRAP